MLLKANKPYETNWSDFSDLFYARAATSRLIINFNLLGKSFDRYSTDTFLEFLSSRGHWMKDGTNGTLFLQAFDPTKRVEMKTANGKHMMIPVKHIVSAVYSYDIVSFVNPLYTEDAYQKKLGLEYDITDKLFPEPADFFERFMHSQMQT